MIQTAPICHWHYYTTITLYIKQFLKYDTQKIALASMQ